MKNGLETLHKAHFAAQEKYTYFLLAAAGAAIGFAVQKVDGMTLSWWLLPVAGAVLCWAGSFYCGCMNQTWVGATVAANVALLQLESGTHAKQPPPHMVHAAIEGVRAALDSNNEKSAIYANLQFWLLIAGAVLFILWRILEMVRATYPQLG